MINYYKHMSEEKTKFSLEVVNKSMLAVDLMHRYKVDSKIEVDDVENKIIKCQEAI